MNEKILTMDMSLFRSWKWTLEGKKARQKWLSEVCWCGVPHRRLTAAAP